MEPSPAESFMSAPSENFSSLFDTPSPALVDIMTPPSAPGDANSPSRSSVAPEDGATGSDKKPTKKRKSWGQVLPEPKTNLPPRKRAKTEDEKEQRRVERVLRNRRAAQSSRERKRQEVEALELKNKDLEDQLEAFRKQNELLRKQLKLQEVGASVSPNSGSSLDDTLSARLFNGSLDKTLNETVNPASLSPEPSAQSPEQASAAPSDVVTQHPAVSDVGGAVPDDSQLSGGQGLLSTPNSSFIDEDELVQPTGFFETSFNIDDWLSTDGAVHAADVITAHCDSASELLTLGSYEPQGFLADSQDSRQIAFQQPDTGASLF